MKLHDSLSKTQKTFPPEEGKVLTMYACGPTVYHYVHIGNLRTFLTVDLLRRYMEHRGSETKLVMNITDVGHMLNDADVGEDKMEKAAFKEGKTPQEIAAFYEQAFFRDLETIGFKPAWKHPRATEHISEMVALIEMLLEKGHAYVTEKGDVYYDVASFEGYGKLSGNSVDALVAGARVEVKEDKHHPADFALWINNPSHVLQWKGPRGIQGYPGWHIECSAMAMKYLGETIDLHAGGEDLKFPHHECEIAQSEGATDARFSKHWLHVTHLLVDGEKMSRSKGNFYTLSDLLDKGFSAGAIRWLLLSAHYRTPLNFTLEGLEAAEKMTSYYREVAARLASAAGVAVAADSSLKTFHDAMDEDLNVSKALAVIADLAKAANRALDAKAMTPEVAATMLACLKAMLGDVFGIELFGGGSEVPTDVQKLAEERIASRVSKDWAASDRLRDEIAGLGWTVEDTAEGQKLKKK